MNKQVMRSYPGIENFTPPPGGETWMSVDPGIPSGLCIWKTEMRRNRYDLIYSDTIKTTSIKGRQNYVLRSLDVVRKLIDRAHAAHAHYIFYEEPTYMPHPTGQVTAKTNSLVHLAMFCGMLVQRADHFDIRCIGVPVSRWKGQMSKDMTRNRVTASLEKLGWITQEWRYSDKISTHQVDAVGIGLHIIGEL